MTVTTETTIANFEVVSEFDVEMAFANTTGIEPDTVRPGRLRSPTVVPGKIDSKIPPDNHTVRLRDLSALDTDSPDFSRMGFDRLNLGPLRELHATLDRVKLAGFITLEDAAVIRQTLQGKDFKLSCGKRLRLLSVATEGLILRKAGPNGLNPYPDEPMTEMNGHNAALSVHADQDVTGTPLRQLMRGVAPYLFRHQSPDSSNQLSPFLLVNLWIPLQQITRPLCLMDRGTLDRRQHQICYSLPTDNFLNRDEDLRHNDIWTFLYDAKQQWYFSSEMDAQTAYVFDTLGTPHGSTILPGESVAEDLYLRLQAAILAIKAGDVAALRIISKDSKPDLPTNTPLPLRKSIEKMAGLLRMADSKSVDALVGPWSTEAENTADQVIRKSIELRAVSLLLPDWWPFNR
jgi:hypothetical protein